MNASWFDARSTRFGDLGIDPRTTVREVHRVEAPRSRLGDPGWNSVPPGTPDGVPGGGRAPGQRRGDGGIYGAGDGLPDAPGLGLPDAPGLGEAPGSGLAVETGVGWGVGIGPSAGGKRTGMGSP